MRLLKPYRPNLLMTGAMLCVILLALQKPVEIRYSQVATISFDWDSLQNYTISSMDTLTSDTLFQVKTSTGITLCYAQDIRTNVCFDNKCRPLNLTVYWNITGRYLGFKLPYGEFLSRYDHEPFTPAEYHRLNELLADPHLPLRNISFGELIQPIEVHADSIDGISGATTKDLLAYVVEGAAYTSYTLWNIVYSETQSVIRRQTEKELTPELLTLILRSPSSEDKVWGLKKINGSLQLNTPLENVLLEIIRSKNFFAAYSALNLIKPLHLKSEALQIGLFSIYEKGDYNLKKQIIELLKDAPILSSAVIKKSRQILVTLNGIQLGYLLELYHRHGIKDVETCRSVAQLLKKKNSFLSKKAYQYLTGLSIKDEMVLMMLKEYKLSK